MRLAWRPLARAVTGGTPLYTTGAMDNKPPLFELLNLLAHLSDGYIVVLTLAVGLANGVAATCIWRACSVRDHARVGGLGALVFLWTLPLVNGVAVNVRSFTVAFLLFALVSRHPVVRGVSVGCALCVSQHAVFAAPVVAYDGYRTAGCSSAWAGRFLAGLSGVVVAAFATVFALWGGWWVGREAGCASTWGPPHLALGLAAALSLHLLVRPFVTYWVYTVGQRL